MNLTRSLLAATVAAIAISGASLATSTDAAAKGGKGFGMHRGHGIHFRHGHRFGHRHYWNHRHFHFRRNYFVRYDSCWKWTRLGWINVCRIAPY